MKKIKRIMVIVGIVLLAFILQINISKTYARPAEGDTPEEIASAMYQYIYDKTDEVLSTLNMGWLLNSSTFLNSSDIANYQIDENGVTLVEELNKDAKRQVKEEEITLDDITESTKIINNAKKDLEKYKKDTYTDADLAVAEHQGNNLKTMYDNAKKVMDYVKSALNSAKSSAGNSSSDDTNPSEFGGDDKTLEETIKDADSFLKEGNSGVLDRTKMQGTSNIIYNTLLVIGTIAAVVIGFVIAIKFMIGSVEEKAEIKKVLITYIVGCVILFGAFIIWKIVLTIANTTL